MTLADLSALAHPAPRAPIGDVLDLIFETIRHAIDNDPRSLQTELGPSELGQACARRLAYTLARTPQLNVRSAAWRPTVGRAVHEWLKGVFVTANAGQRILWLAELEVYVGDYLRRGQPVPVTGHSDLMALLGGAVVDWKIVGPTAIRKYRKARHPGRQYREQAHLYGRGFTLRGLPVDTVCIVFLPSNGELADAYAWHEPYDEQVALDCLDRVTAIQGLVDAVGPAAPAMLPAVEDSCVYCPFYAPGSDDLGRGCPGIEPAPETRQPAFAGLV